MYHHQGAPPFAGGTRAPPNQQQQQGHSATDMMPPVGGFQFPRPTQLPAELESALSIRGTRDMDHRLIEYLDRLNQNQAAAPGIGQHGSYSSALHETQPNQQGVDWSSYEPPSKLFAGPPPSAAHQGPHQAGHAGTSLPNWNPPVNETSAPNPRVEGGRGLYTPESAGTILASFGLSNEDLEALSHYPDDQLTPDTLPFILRDMQIHKTGKQKTAHSSPVPRSPEVPSLLTVTQTEGRVIDYGHASQAKEECSPRETFKKEPLSTERTVKMYPTPPVPKLDTSERRQVRLEPTESIKHGDRDYRRRSSEHHTSRSPPPRDFTTSSKPRHQDRDYRQERLKPQASTEKKSERSEERSVPKQHTSSASKPHSGGSSSKKLPTPTMISDFSGVAPKIYPHTCSLCEMQCDQEKDWIEHLETVNHTAACRHLRTKYPDWKPKLPSRQEYGGRPADHKRHPAGHSASRSASWSPSPPSGKHRVTSYRPRGKPHTPHHQVPRHQHFRDVDDRYERPHPRGGLHVHRRENWERRESAEGSSRPYLKRPYVDSGRRFTGSKGEYVTKRLTKPKPSVKPGNGTTKQSESPSAKKKKKVAPPVVVVGPGLDCLVYLTDIPKDATEQEVINLAGSFGPINNVILMPSSEDDSEKDHGLQASVCMMKPEDAQTFANSQNLIIRDQVITALVAKKPEEEQPSDENSTTKTEEENKSGGAEEQKSDQKALILIEGLPESGWSEEDIIKLAEPFGCPSDIILAKQIGKALLSLPDLETALEMVKVHSFSPATINEQKLKITRIKRKSPVTIERPAALYNLLTDSLDGTERKYIGWSMLVVVSNIPTTPSSASVVHKLVSRIGTVFKTLVINNMVICEMATGLLAAAVHRHYSKFPCIIQNNPLVFSRRPDPKLPAKVIPGFIDAYKNAPENKRDAPPSKLATDNQNESVIKEEPQEEEVKEVEVKSEPVEQELDRQDAVGENTETSCYQTKEEEKNATDATPEANIKTETEIQSIDNEVVMETAEGNNTSDTTPIENGANVPAAEDTTATVTEGEAAMEDVTDIVPVPTASTETETQIKPTNTAAPEQKRTSLERSKEPMNTNSSSSSSREEERRRLDRERRDRERRERDRIRKEREYEERARRDRDRRGDPRREDLRRDDPRREDPRREDLRRDRDRRDRDRKEWERRDGRKRSYGDIDWRSDGSKRTHYRDERHKSSTERSTVEEDFPFNLSDFVTVDEVGDVDTSEVPNPDLDVSMETTEAGQESSEPPQLEAEVAPMDVSTEPKVKSEEEKVGVTVARDEVKEQEKVEEVKEASCDAADMKAAEKPVEEVDVREPTTDPVPAASAPDAPAQAATAQAAPAPAAAASAPDAPAQAAAAPAQAAPAPAVPVQAAPAQAAPAPAVPVQAAPAPAVPVQAAPAQAAPAPDAPVQAAPAPDAPAPAVPVQAAPAPDAPAQAAPAPDAPAPADPVGTSETVQETSNPPQQGTAEVSAPTIMEEEEVAPEKEVKEEEQKEQPTAAAKIEKPKKTEKDATETTQTDSSEYPLPAFNPNNPVGMEFLVPMTGFFCKVCTRFFTGSKDTEISHSKTLKHYENLQKFLKNRNTASASAASST